MRWAGYLADAEKEYAEANVTLALVAGEPVPGPGDVGVEDAPYLNGIAESIGEGRRHILDLLRTGEWRGPRRSFASWRTSTRSS